MASDEHDRSYTSSHRLQAARDSTVDLTLKEAAAITGLSQKTLRRGVRAGTLASRWRANPHGPQLTIARAELLRWAGGHPSRRHAARRPAPLPDAPCSDLLALVRQLDHMEHTQRQMLRSLTRAVTAVAIQEETIQRLEERIGALIQFTDG